jgi:hypothetical protein
MGKKLRRKHEDEDREWVAPITETREEVRTDIRETHMTQAEKVAKVAEILLDKFPDLNINAAIGIAYKIVSALEEV